MKPYRVISWDGKALSYAVHNFPDGTSNVVLDHKAVPEACTSVTVNVDAPYCNDTTLWHLMLLKDALSAVIPDCTVNVFFSYLPHARADRRFSLGSAAPLEVFLSTLKRIGFKSIFAVVPHSDHKDVTAIMRQPIEDLKRIAKIDKDCTIMFPDNGAYGRFEKFFIDDYWSGGGFIVGSKHRTMSTGNINEYRLSNEPEVIKERVVIFDDICDGGATFIAAAEALRKRYGNAIRIDLAVVHGIFSKGLEVFDGIIDNVYYYQKIS